MEHIAQRFFEVFGGLHRAHGRYTLSDPSKEGKKQGGKATTVHGDYTATLWEKHLAGEQGLGVVPITDDGTVWFGAIDIDIYDLDLSILERDIASFNLPLLPTRTKSGGAHLYVFFSEPTSAGLVRGKLAEWAVALGYGGVEIFPKQIKLASESDVGNWINMPYFNGDDTERYGILKGAKLTAAEYLMRAQQLRLTEEMLEQISVAEVPGLEDGPPCLQSLAQRGFPEGTRNVGLFNLGVYARMRYGDDLYSDETAKFNATLMQPPLSHSEVSVVLKSLGRKKYFYTCDKEPFCSVCNKQLCASRKYGIDTEAELDITIDNDAIKILTNPPYWIIGVNGVRMEVTANDLKMQERFRLLCMEKIDHLPTKLRPHRWDETVRYILQNAEPVEAPSDAGPHGQFQFLLEQFCTMRAQASTQQELLIGKPWNDAGRIYFRSGDLVKYLENEHFRDFNKRQVYAALRDMGVKHHQFQIDGKCVQCWSLPEYTGETTSLPVPKRESETF